MIQLILKLSDSNDLMICYSIMTRKKFIRIVSRIITITTILRLSILAKLWHLLYHSLRKYKHFLQIFKRTILLLYSYSKRIKIRKKKNNQVRNKKRIKRKMPMKAMMLKMQVGKKRISERNKNSMIKNLLQ